jgi:tripartite-type tricarboxylate transporter receptor subunit TctC
MGIMISLSQMRKMGSVPIFVVAALAFGLAHAQEYPTKTIRMIIPLTPGSGADIAGRIIAQRLSEHWKQPVIVENRPGANGYIAWNYVANSEPDGYTLLMAENALAISQGLFKKSASSFDPLKQYDAIAQVATSPLALVVANKVPANNLGELIRLARTTPEKMNYASAGIGSVAHLTFEVFRDGAGIEAVHIPYKGGGQAIGDIVAGQVEMHMASVAVAKPLVEAGRIKAMAVTGAKRSPALPDVPTLAEAGVKTADVDLGFWYALFGPKGLPNAVRAKLDKAVATVMADPAVRARLAKLDIEPAYAPAGALHKKLDNEITNWTRFIDQKGIKAE